MLSLPSDENYRLRKEKELKNIGLYLQECRAQVSEKSIFPTLKWKGENHS
jgi:hypothetical protein